MKGWAEDLCSIFTFTRACRLSLEKWWSSYIKCVSHAIAHLLIHSKGKLWKIRHTIHRILGDRRIECRLCVYIIKFITVGRDYHHRCDAVRICKCSFLPQNWNFSYADDFSFINQNLIRRVFCAIERNVEWLRSLFVVVISIMNLIKYFPRSSIFMQIDSRGWNFNFLRNNFS